MSMPGPSIWLKGFPKSKETFLFRSPGALSQAGIDPNDVAAWGQIGDDLSLELELDSAGKYEKMFQSGHDVEDMVGPSEIDESRPTYPVW